MKKTKATTGHSISHLLNQPLSSSEGRRVAQIILEVLRNAPRRGDGK